VIDVSVDHRQGRPRPSVVLEPLLGQQREAPAVVESRHVVAQRHRPQLVLERAAPGDVGGRDDDVGQRPDGIAQRRQRAGDEQTLPCARHPVTLEWVSDCALGKAPQAIPERRDGFADREHRGELASVQVVIGVAGRELHAAIGLQDATGGVEHEDERVGRLEYGSKEIALRFE
jgi:hypothetical protein